ncbi:MAG: efflux RND transporter periplasmic adaptor subunit [Thermodesulfobacteriota bacterium]
MLRPRTFVILLLLAGLAGGGFYWWRSAQAPAEPKILATARVERGAVRKELDSTGIVKAQVGAIVKIGAQATGRLVAMPVKVGDAVERGQVIARIDDRDLSAQLAQAEAGLARARAELAVARAQDQYARENLARQQDLFARGVVARDALDQAERDAAVQTRTLTAKQAAVAEAEASIAVFRTKLSHTVIQSPIAGVVSQVTVQEGETVVTGLQTVNLITVLDPSRLEMWIYVDETDVGQVAPGLRVEFTVDAYPGRTFAGTIGRIHPQPEVRDNIVYYQALVALDQGQARDLRPEMTTLCRIVVQEKPDALSLPNAALKWVDGEQVAYRVREGRAEKVKPRLGLAGLARSEVLEGLAEGDEVATQLVLPGAKKKPNGRD